MLVLCTSTKIYATFQIKKEKSGCKFLNNLLNCKMSNSCLKGACLTPINFYITFNCNPNTKKCITNDQKVIVFALQPIKKNTPVRI